MVARPFVAKTSMYLLGSAVNFCIFDDSGNRRVWTTLLDSRRASGHRTSDPSEIPLNFDIAIAELISKSVESHPRSRSPLATKSTPLFQRNASREFSSFILCFEYQHRALYQSDFSQLKVSARLFRQDFIQRLLKFFDFFVE